MTPLEVERFEFNACPLFKFISRLWMCMRTNICSLTKKKRIQFTYVHFLQFVRVRFYISSVIFFFYTFILFHYLFFIIFTPHYLSMLIWFFFKNILKLIYFAHDFSHNSVSIRLIVHMIYLFLLVTYCCGVVVFFTWCLLSCYIFQHNSFILWDLKKKKKNTIHVFSHDFLHVTHLCSRDSFIITCSKLFSLHKINTTQWKSIIMGGIKELLKQKFDFFFLSTCKSQVINWKNAWVF